MIPLPTVFATAVVAKAPARFAIAAISTAMPRRERPRRDGRRDRVGSVVEAVGEVERERDDDRDDEQRHRLPILDEDRLEDVGGVLARVDRLFELLVDVLPADDRQRVGARAEEIGDRLAREPVALVLELAQRGELPATSP